MKPTFNDPPLATIGRFQAHLDAFEAGLQTELDRLHARYPHRFAKARVDASELRRTADRLFRLGRVYIGSYSHGIDCPAAHAETIRDTVRLFEDVCLNRQSSQGLYGGVSAGKSGVLTLFRLLLGPLCGLSDCRYIPQLIQPRRRSTVETSLDTMAAFMELYGGVEIIRMDGVSLPIIQFTYNLEAAFGKAATHPIVSRDEMLRLKGEYTKHGYGIIALCDDAHRMVQFNDLLDQPASSPTVEDIINSFDSHILATMKPELLPPSCHVRPLERSHEYASTHPWHRGESLADAKVNMLALPDFMRRCDADRCDLYAMSVAALRWAHRHDIAALYYRVADHVIAARLQDYLARASGIESILCDGKSQRSEVSDWCWSAFRREQPFAIISGGPNPRFHRSLPPSVGVFIDWTQSALPAALARGLCASASGYGCRSNLVVMSSENVLAVHQSNLRHRAYHRAGLHVGRLTPGMNYLANSIDSGMIRDDVEVLDLLRVIQQQGKLSVDLYGLEIDG